jgi:hypothetical protein
VQEDLEHYFLQHQAAQQQLKDLQQRGQALLDKNPSHSEFAELHVEADKNGSARWQFKQVQIGGRRFPELIFRTVLDGGMAGLVFERHDKNSGPLLRWPASAQTSDILELLPAGEGVKLQSRLAVLAQLATGDWKLLHALCLLLKKLLHAEGAVTLPAVVDRTALSTGMARLEETLPKFPKLLRFDHVTLKREQVNPDYEHLWLQVENLSFRANEWQRFEYRLSCAHVAPGRFGLFPKLEFPEAGGQAPFTGWYVEASDDFGPKLELRFSVEHGLDIAAWNKLPEQDREFIMQLTHVLPMQLALLQSEGFSPARPWQEWYNMVQAMQQMVFRNQKEIPQKTSPAAQVAVLKPTTAVAGTQKLSRVPRPHKLKKAAKVKRKPGR